jgi:hypothetical protein
VIIINYTCSYVGNISSMRVFVVLLSSSVFFSIIQRLRHVLNDTKRKQERTGAHFERDATRWNSNGMDAYEATENCHLNMLLILVLVHTSHNFWEPIHPVVKRLVHHADKPFITNCKKFSILIRILTYRLRSLYQCISMRNYCFKKEGRLSLLCCMHMSLLPCNFCK